jgi:tetratricopeptide (TPR) repeat protein
VHPDVAESVTNLANLAFAREDFATALVHHRRALGIKREVFDEGAPEIAVALVNLGMTELSMKSWDDAYTHNAEAIAVLQGKVPPADPHLALAYAGGGEAALERGEKAEAVAWLAAALYDDAEAESSIDLDRVRDLLTRATRLP